MGVAGHGRARPKAHAPRTSRPVPPRRVPRAAQGANAALAALLSPSAHPQHRAKLDAERARRTFLLYTSRLHSALTSPRTCYFSGFAAVGPRLVSQLRRQVLGGGGGCLDGEGAGLLAQLGLWTQCCEVSAAAAVQDCLREGLEPGQGEHLGGGGGGGGDGGGHAWRSAS
jgi:hypothetical protein